MRKRESCYTRFYIFSQWTWLDFTRHSQNLSIVNIFFLGAINLVSEDYLVLIRMVGTKKGRKEGRQEGRKERNKERNKQGGKRQRSKIKCEWLAQLNAQRHTAELSDKREAFSNWPPVQSWISSSFLFLYYHLTLLNKSSRREMKRNLD